MFDFMSLTEAGFLPLPFQGVRRTISKRPHGRFCGPLMMAPQDKFCSQKPRLLENIDQNVERSARNHAKSHIFWFLIFIFDFFFGLKIFLIKLTLKLPNFIFFKVVNSFAPPFKREATLFGRLPYDFNHQKPCWRLPQMQ